MTIMACFSLHFITLFALDKQGCSRHKTITNVHDLMADFVDLDIMQEVFI